MENKTTATHQENNSLNSTNSAPKKAVREYNGHPSYRHWNADLWFGNDESLYQMVMNAKSPISFIRECNRLGIDRTEDGVPLSKRVLKYVWESFHN